MVDAALPARRRARGVLRHLAFTADAVFDDGTRPDRDGVKIRYGVTWLPLLWLPFMVQPTVMGVWEFQD